MKATILTSLSVALLVILGGTTFTHAQDADRELSECPSYDYPDKPRREAAMTGRHDPPPPPPTDYDVVHYDLDLAVDFAAEVVSGTVAITATSVVDSLAQLELDLLDNMAVSEITRDDIPLAFVHAGDRILIDLDQVFGLDDTLTVAITYAGTPEEGDVFVSDPFEFNEHNGVPVATTFSEPWYARYWWPCKEDPSDKALADIAFTVPADMIAASNGLLTEVIDHGATKTYRWHSSYPIANYLISGAMTNYAMFSDEYELEMGGTMPLDYYVYPEHLADATQAWAVTPDMLALFRDHFGEYPFRDEKYGIAMWPGTGMENQTLSSIGSCCFQSTTLLSHELAHQWWGDLVTCATWHDIWLNEGFATWAACLWEGVESPPNGYVECLEDADHPGSWDGPVYREDVSGVLVIFNSVVYGKGAWVLHMLRGVLGEGPFFGALRTYRDAFAYRSATTADFQAAVETHVGQGLAWFFDEWVYGEGRPDYEYSWEADTPEVGQLTLHIEQVQTDAPLFKMPIQIDIVTITGNERFVVWDSLATQAFVLDPAGEPTGVVFDPEDWILEYHHEVPVGIAEALGQDARPGIDAILPTPSSRGVTLSFHTPSGSGGQDQWTSLSIYDVNGRRVRTLIKAVLASGSHIARWDGHSDLGRRVSPGVYFARLKHGGMTAARRLILVE
jgi:aminopeptidase N